MSFAASDAPPPRRSRRWLWWGLGGCGGVFVLVVAAVVVIVVVIAHSANPNGNCLPRGFPVDPSLSKVTTVDIAGTCTTAYRTDRSADSVEAYYATALDANGWQVLSKEGGTIRFQRRGHAQEAGSVTVTTRKGTRVAVILRG
ncbi:MAG: hypothetical protein ACREQM_01120 [Candidatus Dormibacteraceae bacterium]